MIAFLDDHRGVFGVGPICRVLGIAPSTFYSFKAGERDPVLASDRAKQDRLDMAAIKKAFDDSRGRYGARKVWHQLRREGRDIARCTVERLMKVMGLQGVVRGKKVVTTNSDAAQLCPDDKVIPLSAATVILHSPFILVHRAAVRPMLRAARCALRTSAGWGAPPSWTRSQESMGQWA